MIDYAEKVLSKISKKAAGDDPPPEPPQEDSTGGEYQPFPTHLLPCPLQRFIDEAAASFGCDPGFVALPALVACAGCIGNKRAIQLKRKFVQPCILWGVVVGPSGSMKTPPFILSFSPLYEIQHRWIEEGRQEEERFEEFMEAYQLRRTAAYRKDEEFTEAPPERPATRRVLAYDTTVERIAVDLSDNPAGIILARPELNGWLGSFARYRSAGSDLQTWLEFFDGTSVIVDRKGGDKKTMSIARASVSVCGGIPPGTLQEAFSPQNLEAGLGARFLIVNPPTKEHFWSEVEVDPGTLQTYSQVIHGCLDLAWPNNDPAAGPVVYTLDREAKRCWVDWYNRWERRKHQAEFEPLRAAYSKLHGYAARLALVHHVVNGVWEQFIGHGPPADHVGVESVQAGTQLAEWFGREARQFYLSMPTESELVTWIRRKGGSVTARDLVTNRKAENSEDAKRTLSELVFTGHLKEKKEGKKVIYSLSESSQFF